VGGAAGGGGGGGGDLRPDDAYRGALGKVIAVGRGPRSTHGAHVPPGEGFKASADPVRGDSPSAKRATRIVLEEGPRPLATVLVQAERGELDPGAGRFVAMDQERLRAGDGDARTSSSWTSADRRWSSATLTTFPEFAHAHWTGRRSRRMRRFVRILLIAFPASLRRG